MNTKRLIAGSMTALILAGGVLERRIPTLADEILQETDISIDTDLQLSKDNSIPLIDMQTEFLAVDTLEAPTNAFTIRNAQTDSPYSLSEGEWDGSGSDYYFSLLNTSEKKLYLSLKKQAAAYLTGTDNFHTTTVTRNEESVQVSVFPLVSYEGLTTEQMKKVFYCFMFENPHYYFMRNSVIYSENTNMMTVGLYDIFADGTTRAEYTHELATMLQGWEEQINECGSTAEKEQRIHNLVCEHVDYNNTMAVDDPDDREMSQSCISAILFNRSTVCAGYAQMFALLCNRADIECVTVTSASHAWNKVRMSNIWYNVDCTWNDCRGDSTFLNITDEQLSASDTGQQEHLLSAEWEGIAPPCTISFDLEMANGSDSTPNILEPGEPANISVLEEEGKITIRFEPMERCDGYTVQYAANNAMNQANKKDIENTSYEITGLKSGKEYYIRVRAYRLDRNGEKLYGAFSKKVKAVAK